MQNYPLILYRDGFETYFGEHVTDTITVTNETEYRFATVEGWSPAVEYLQRKIVRAANPKPSLDRRPITVTQNKAPAIERRKNWMRGPMPMPRAGTSGMGQRASMS